jgi:kumamolisin
LKFTIHLKPGTTVDSIIKHNLIVKFLRSKNLLVNWHPGQAKIRFESSNPGIITHLKKQFGEHITAILSDKHGAGQYKRPSQHVTPQQRIWNGTVKAHGLFGPNAVSLTPMQVAKAYNFPTPGPTIKDQVVAIIELGGAFNPKDVLNYCKQENIPYPRLYYHLVDGTTEVPDPNGADGEVSLDIDVVAAVAPGCKILVVFAPNASNGFIDAVAGLPNYALKPNVLSLSWGSPESDWDPAAMEALNNALQSCVNAGINVFVAAGDDGSSDGTAGTAVDFPSSSPYSISCGGTKLILNSDGSRNSEVVWNELLTGEGATGGGVSAVYPQPPEQAKVDAVPGTSGKRCVPDISGNADPNSGYIVNVDGTQSVIGGTSAVAPLMAGLTVLLASHTPVGNLKDVLYANPGVCFDVISGNNGAFSAGPGYDMCSGLGVPDGTKLLNVLKPTAVQKLVKFLKRPLISFIKH